jgi:hypothetical protein
VTLAEWTAEMRGALKQAGFTVDEFMGFPLVRTPPTLEGKDRLLRLALPYGHEKRIYADGVLLVPTA